MHTLTYEDGTAIVDLTGRKMIYILLDLELPDSLGGHRHWAIADRDDLTRGGHTYSIDSPFINVVPPSNPQVSMLDQQNFSVELADVDMVWRDLVGLNFAGTYARVWYKWSIEGKLTKERHAWSGPGQGKPSHDEEKGTTRLSFLGGVARVSDYRKPVLSTDFFRGRDATDNGGDFIESSQEIRAGSTKKSRRLS